MVNLVEFQNLKLLWVGSEEDVNGRETIYFLFEGSRAFSICDGEIAVLRDPKATFMALCNAHLDKAKALMYLHDILNPKPPALDAPEVVHTCEKAKEALELIT